MSNCIIIGNSASADGGGVQGGTLNNCEIVSNVSRWSGGGASDSTLNNCWVINNHAEVTGGGVDLCNANNCLISGNSAGGNSAGGPFSFGGGASCTFRNTLNNCTLVGNSAKLGGGAFNGTLNNCIVYYNNGGNYASYVSNVQLINLNYCCTVPLPRGSGNITNEPLFIDLAARNLRLQPNSRCINAGNSAYAPAGPDLDGNARIVGGTVDMGAYERPLLAPVVSCAAVSSLECGVPVQVTVNVSDPDAETLTVFWSVNGQTVQTNLVPASSSVEGTNVSIIAQLPLGTNTVEVLVSDNAANTASCSTTVTVIDTTAPVIVAANAQPNILWPPNHQMVPVTVTAQVTDNCGLGEWKIIGVRSNEPVNGPGHGKTAADWVITGDHTLSLRAERTGVGRIYSIIIQAKDPSGNASEKTAQVWCGRVKGGNQDSP